MYYDERGARTSAAHVADIVGGVVVVTRVCPRYTRVCVFCSALLCKR